MKPINTSIYDFPGIIEGRYVCLPRPQRFGKVEINGAKAVDGSYDLPEGSPDARFFKAFLRP